MAQKLEETRAYYDDFAKRYEAQRRPNDPHGYHALVDDLEVELVERYGRGKEVLEAGCGTGLLLDRLKTFASRAAGFDLSPGMLELARLRGLDVREGSVTEIPFEDGSFDVVCSFKVLAHVPDIERALAEMARVTRKGGVVIAELYNPWSLRGAVKRLGPKGAISNARDEGDVYTRYDSPADAQRLVPVGCRFETARGIRIVTPAALAFRVPIVGRLLPHAERALADTRLASFAGFYAMVMRKV